MLCQPAPLPSAGGGFKVQLSILNTHAIDTQIYQYTSITLNLFNFLNHFNMFSSCPLSLEPWSCKLNTYKPLYLYFPIS